ncbi:MAG: hypothetical protein NDJ18_10315 [candidate division Zixibacteria bacterium]|nr:hypothetical protein [candidate division Zixibacteria bacterium]
MRAAIFLTTVLTAALGGCQPSILPYYSITDVTSLSGLVGIWEPADGEEETWAITGDSSRYNIIHKTPERIKEFEMRLFKLNGKYFGDIVQPIKYSQDAFDPDLYAQQHLLARLILSGDTLQVGILNDEWFVQMIDDEAITVPFVEMSSGYLITATADQMRPVILKYADDPDAFPIAALVRVGD